ncbi:MAG: class I SAM-dependent methyltransferase [Patescibacteria group bacterium]|jgi:ubiquinone/menaquinone biosynthesis C-methylase UbiE
MKKKLYHKSETIFSESHPVLRDIRKLVRNKRAILEVECGKGNRLKAVSSNNEELAGTNTSKDAMRQAKSLFPEYTFVEAEPDSLPFTDNYFNVAYCFKLCQTSIPEKVIKEMIRVVRTRGLVVFVDENFGAPLWCFPERKTNRTWKLLSGFIGDAICLIAGNRTGKLSWKQFKLSLGKQSNQNNKDMVTEPYLRSLVSFLRSLGLEIVTFSSFWELNKPSNSVTTTVCRILGKLGVYPFRYWGPQLFVVARK